ncbi:MAG: prealbumin-like fold domain-containing protein [Actinomycetota bacterium]
MKAPARPLLVAVATATASLIPLTAEAATEHPVRTTPAGEFQPARGPNHLAWEQNTKGQPNHYDVFVQPDGGQAVRVNAGRSNAAMGGIDDDLLVYQQYRKKQSDLYLSDLNTGQRTRLPKKVNSRLWEYWPDISEPWLLFGRWKMSNDARQLILHNLETGQQRVLNRIRGSRAFIGPGQVNGDYVVWWRCPSKGRCQVYRYQISTATRSKVPNPGSYQRAPSVNAEGTVFLARGGKGCGGAVQIVKIAPDGTETILTHFPEGLDSRDTYAYTDEGGVTHVYYERFGCGKKTGSDIYQVMDPELASLAVTTAGTGIGTVTSTPSGINCGMDCSEEYPGGTQVTLQANPAPGSYFAGWGGACTGTAPCNLTMDAAKNVTATFELLGSITVVKDAIPNDPTPFEFDPSSNLQAENFFLDDDGAGSNQQVFNSLTAGTYTVQEVHLPAGWQIADLGCEGDMDGDTTTGMSLATINLDPGEDVVCTYTNAKEGSITIVKDALPDHPQDFDFDPSPNLQTTNFLLDDDPDSSRPNQETFQDLDVPDTYTVQEVNIPGGWELTDIECAGGGPNTTGSIVTATATIGLDAGEAVVCTFENTEEGSITVVKDAVNNSAQDFGFSTTGDLSPSTFTLDDDGAGSNQRVYVGLLPGAYSVTEDPDPPGWRLTNLACTDPDGGTTWSVATRTATIDLDPGEDVTCTFTNTEEGTITIIKDALPNSPQDFGFSTTGGLTPATFTLDDDGAGSNQRTFSDLLPGTYSVSENADPAGWQLTDITCVGGGGNTSDTGRTATIGLDPGEDVVCTFENTEEGSITVIKDAVNNDPQDFGFSTTGGLSPSTFTLDDDSDPTLSNQRVYTDLLPGTYSVSENADPAGWQLTDIACVGGGPNTSDAGRTATIGLDPGENVVCTFTNTEEGSITIVKDAQPDSAQNFEFDPSANLDPGPNFFLDDDSDPTLSNQRVYADLLPGTYSVSEVNIPANWSLTTLACAGGGGNTTTANPTATIGLDPGEDVVCTFTNTGEGSITIVKDAVDDDPQDFGFSTTGGLSPATFSLDDDADGTLENTRTFTDVAAGNYTVTEDADPAGWQLTDLECVGGGPDTSEAGRTASIGLDPGEDVVCTFTNTEEGSITVIKDAVNNSAQDFGFSTTGGLTPATFSLDDDSDPSLSNQQVFADLLPGTYTVSENADPAGWQLTDITCVGGGPNTSDTARTASIGLDPGEDVVCTFTNTEQGTIIVAKETDPDGSTQSFEFDTDYGPNFFLQDGQTNNSGFLDPGTYSVSELTPSGWDVTSATCSDGSSPGNINLSAGEAVTCTFNNRQDGRIVVTKQTIPDGSPQNFTFSRSYGPDFVLSDGQSSDSGFTLNPGTYSVSETVPEGWTLTDASCSDGSAPGSINLSAGETVTCTFENTQQGTITIAKETNPDGALQSFEFDPSYGPNFFLSDGETNSSGNLAPGSYTVIETVPPLWQLGSIVCIDPEHF